MDIKNKVNDFLTKARWPEVNIRTVAQVASALRPCMENLEVLVFTFYKVLFAAFKHRQFILELTEFPM